MYDRFSGGRERSLRTLERALARTGTAASAECVWVAELDGRPAAAMAGFPVSEAPARARGFLRVALRSLPLKLWPRSLRLYWMGGRASPPPPASAFYVDALATDTGLRRRGAARALLDEAERQALRRGLRSVALDTTVSNHAARALYATAGYEEVATRPPVHGLPAFVALVKSLAPVE